MTFLISGIIEGEVIFKWLFIRYIWKCMSKSFVPNTQTATWWKFSSGSELFSMWCSNACLRFRYLPHVLVTVACAREIWSLASSADIPPRLDGENRRRLCCVNGPVTEISYVVIYDIYFVNCTDTRWQQYSTHLHTNSTQNNTVYLLTAVWLTPGGSSPVHIYTQTVHRATQWYRIHKILHT
jgi:hypothetical protein